MFLDWFNFSGIFSSGRVQVIESGFMFMPVFAGCGEQDSLQKFRRRSVKEIKFLVVGAGARGGAGL